MLRSPVSKRNVISISLGVLAMAAIVLVVMSRVAQASDEERLRGTFSVAASVRPNTLGVVYCGGTAYDLAVEAHGAGYSTLGAMSLSLQKTIQAAGPSMHGCLTLTAPNGDTLEAIYDGTENSPNANNFIVGATGTLTFTGGTGRFEGASGSAKFTADFRVGAPVIAFYTVDGNVLLEH